MGYIYKGEYIYIVPHHYLLADQPQGAHPLDLHKSNGPSASRSTPSKKARSHHSFVGNFNQSPSPPRNHGLEIPSSYTKSLTPDSISYLRSISPIAPSKMDSERSSPESQWEFVDSEILPLRWVNDYVPLASPGSRLVNQNILSYAFWCDENRQSRGGQLLAVATKNNILLYETPKGERAFRFVKVRCLFHLTTPVNFALSRTFTHRISHALSHFSIKTCRFSKNPVGATDGQIAR